MTQVTIKKPFTQRNYWKYPLLDPSQRTLEVDFNWAEKLTPHERLFQHNTLSSARRNAKYKTPSQAPNDELDYILEAAYCPLKTTFADKGDVYIHSETMYGDDPNFQSWRLLRNRRIVIPPVPPPLAHPIRYGGVKERDSLYHIKLGIASNHSPQTNPGFSRTPSGSLYSI